MKVNKKPILIVLLLCLIQVVTFAQNNQVLHLNRAVYQDISYLQKSGYLLALNPTNLPYKTGEVSAAMSEIKVDELSRLEKFWYDRVNKELTVNNKKIDQGDIYTVGILEGGFDLNNTVEKDGIREADDIVLFMPNGALMGYAEKGNISVQLGLAHDLYYDKERFGYNTLSRTFVRSEDYYIGYNSNFFSANIGRFNYLWAPYGETSTVITDNTRSFDNISFDIGPEWFKVSSIYGELDNLSTNGIFERRNLFEGIKRNIALHRIDLKISDKLRLTYFDGFIQSGNNLSLSLRYLSPVNFFFFERNSYPANEQFNAFFGGNIWSQFGNITFNLQLFLDDIIINSPDNSQEPTTLAITNSLYWSEFLPSLSIGYELEMIGYQTYNTDQAEGRYLYAGRGIATQNNDYILGKLFLKYHFTGRYQGLSLEPKFEFLAQGEQNINQEFVESYPNGEIVELFVTGIPEYTKRASLGIEYDPNPYFWLNAEIGANFTKNPNHIQNQSDSKITFRLESGFRISVEELLSVF
ncbi:MAG: hypothetical protein JJ892_06845 [Balneola sp.]|nr:hypothetical protein [Balneola sp.]MBO6651954.1 hypothetical protein [Balneola sp.]MBO6711789.1 hypothetical protein [Balneola sp.]MBO6799983.1 hypothetical protein [Balneola sp.]MBO6871228.1 hypothetical protein [Balneola sp.]